MANISTFSGDIIVHKYVANISTFFHGDIINIYIWQIYRHFQVTL